MYSWSGWDMLSSPATHTPGSLVIMLRVTNMMKWFEGYEFRREQEFLFLTIPGNTSLQFPFSKFGKEFYIPVLKSWEFYFYSHSFSGDRIFKVGDATYFSFQLSNFGKSRFCSQKCKMSFLLTSLSEADNHDDIYFQNRHPPIAIAGEQNICTRLF